MPILNVFNGTFISSAPKFFGTIKEKKKLDHGVCILPVDISTILTHWDLLNQEKIIFYIIFASWVVMMIFFFIGTLIFSTSVGGGGFRNDLVLLYKNDLCAYTYKNIASNRNCTILCKGRPVFLTPLVVPSSNNPYTAQHTCFIFTNIFNTPYNI